VIPDVEVDRIERHLPEAWCTGGGERVIDPHPPSRPQVFDLPEITYSVTEHQRFGGACRGCQRTVKA
jgi:hypothetical protein